MKLDFDSLPLPTGPMPTGPLPSTAAAAAALPLPAVPTQAQPQPAYGSPNRMAVLANGDIVDCARLPQTARNNLYKTELCKHFTENGACRYGAKCQFAHGEDELRGVLRHPKYKTTRCKAFLATGKCMYGSRCRFIHTASLFDDDDLRDNMSTASESDDQDSPLKDLLVNPYGNPMAPIDLATPFGGGKHVTLLPLAPVGANSLSGQPNDQFGEPFGDFPLEGFGALSLEPETGSSVGSSGSSLEAALDAVSPRFGRSGSNASTSSRPSRLSIFQRICREDE